MSTPTPRPPGPANLSEAEISAGRALAGVLGARVLRSCRVFGTASPHWAGLERILRAGIEHKEHS